MNNYSNFEIKELIKKIIVEIVNLDLDEPVTVNDLEDDETLGENRRISLNSVKAIKMVIEIENEFNISIPDEDLDMRNFNSVNTIMLYLKNVMENQRGI